MGFTRSDFTPTTGLKDTSAFPTNPPDEAAARKQVQDVLDQLKDSINTLEEELEAKEAAEKIGITYGGIASTLQAFVSAVEQSGTGTTPGNDVITNNMMKEDVKIGSLASLVSEITGDARNSITAAINFVIGWIGNISTLSTTAKTNIVVAINEVISKTIGLLTAKGDMLYRGDTDIVKLPIGIDGKILQVVDGIPSWQTLHNIQKFTSSGTFTAPKAGVYKITVVGGGASSGRTGLSGSGWFYIAGAGGPGGTAVKYVTLTKGQVVPVTVGAGGAIPGPSTSIYGNTGTQGGTSSFGSMVSATGGNGSSPSNTSSGNGASGDGVNGDYNIRMQSSATIGSTNSSAAPQQPSFLGLNYGYGGYGVSGAENFANAGGAGVVIVEW